MEATGTRNPARPLVVVVSGTSGAGKSSLVAALVDALRRADVAAETLHFDDFTDVPDLPGGDLTGWLARGADPREWPTPAMEDALTALLSGEAASGRTAVVVVEEPFGRTRPPFDLEADLSLHLRLPPGVALARRLLRDFVPRAGGLEAAAVARLRHHLVRFVAEGYALYEAVEGRALTRADLVLDALQDQQVVTHQALAAVLGALSEEPRNR